MEIIEKQVEKVKEVPADNYGYNYGRRDINGKANAGLKPLLRVRSFFRGN